MHRKKNSSSTLSRAVLEEPLLPSYQPQSVRNSRSSEKSDMGTNVNHKLSSLADDAALLSASLQTHRDGTSQHDNEHHNNDVGNGLAYNLVPRNESEARLLDRQGAYCQSRGRWSVKHVSRDEARQYYYNRNNNSSSNNSMNGTNQNRSRAQDRRLPRHKILWTSWFYTLAYQKTLTLMVILFVVYTALVFLFAFIYLGVSILGEERKTNEDGSIVLLPFCSMDIHNHMEALYFSLSTMTTIGYGVSDYYFGECWTPFMLVLAQTCCALIFNAVAIGILFQRISRGHNRSKTVVLSDQAVVKRVDGELYLMFRIGELRHHFLLEATVRAYCLGHERCRVSEPRDGEEGYRVETTHFVTKSLPLLHQNTSPCILMSLPQVLVHRMDPLTSPLLPPIDRPWCDARGMWHPPTSKSDDNTKHTYWNDELSSIQDYWRDRSFEVVVLVEGTDELTGASIQTRHSYTFGNIAWNHKFKPCIIPRSNDGADEVNQRSWLYFGTSGQTKVPTCVVDFALFHETELAPVNTPEDPYVPEKRKTL